MQKDIEQIVFLTAFPERYGHLKGKQIKVVDCVENPDAVKGYFTHVMRKCKVGNTYKIAIDTETTGLDQFKNEILLTGIGNSEIVVIYDCTSIDFTKIFEHDEYYDFMLVAHNAKFDYNMLTQAGYKHKNWWCTMVIEKKLNQNRNIKYDYYSTLYRHLNFRPPMEKDERLSFIGRNAATFVASEMELMYLAYDVAPLVDIANSQLAALSENHIPFIMNVELPLINVLGDAETTGFELNKEKLAANAEVNLVKIYETACKLDEEFRRLRGSKKTLRGGKFDRKRNFKPVHRQMDIFGNVELNHKVVKQEKNLKYSTVEVKQIAAELNLYIPTLIKKGSFEAAGPIAVPSYEDDKIVAMEINGTKHHGLNFTTKKNYLLKAIIDNPDNPANHFLSLLSEYRGYCKEFETYGYNLIDCINPKTGRIHTVFNQCMNNGRLGSGGGDKQKDRPNLQNQPRKNEIRSCYSDGVGRKILTCDLSGKNKNLKKYFMCD